VTRFQIRYDDGEYNQSIYVTCHAIERVSAFGVSADGVTIELETWCVIESIEAAK
jgi:hypothetical protein